MRWTGIEETENPRSVQFGRTAWCKAQELHLSVVWESRCVVQFGEMRIRKGEVTATEGLERGMDNGKLQKDFNKREKRNCVILKTYGQ